jgi:hypothetical protein
MRAIDDVRVDVQRRGMLAWPNCSCAIFTGTRRSLSSDEDVAELMPRHAFDSRTSRRRLEHAFPAPSVRGEVRRTRSRAPATPPLGMAAALETRLRHAQTEKLTPIDLVSMLASDELARRALELMRPAGKTVSTVDQGPVSATATHRTGSPDRAASLSFSVSDISVIFCRVVLPAQSLRRPSRAGGFHRVRRERRRITTRSVPTAG